MKKYREEFKNTLYSVLTDSYESLMLFPTQVTHSNALVGKEEKFKVTERGN